MIEIKWILKNISKPSTFLVLNIGTANNLKHEQAIKKSHIKLLMSQPRKPKIWIFYDKLYSKTNKYLVNYLCVKHKIVFKRKELSNDVVVYKNDKLCTFLIYVKRNLTTCYPQTVNIPQNQKVKNISVLYSSTNVDWTKERFPRWSENCWASSQPICEFYCLLQKLLGKTLENKGSVVINHRAIFTSKDLNPRVVQLDANIVEIKSRGGYLLTNKYMDSFSEVGWIYVHLKTSFPNRIKLQ